MTGRIVVGIDGSQESGQALEWAVARAQLGGEELQLVNAYRLTPELDFYGFHGVVNPAVDHIVELSEQVLDAAAARAREVAPGVTCTLTSTLAHPADALAGVSEGADAVVVGRRGLGRAASALLGSVSNSLTVRAKSPLVVVGGSDAPTEGPIVVGVDGSDFGMNALRYAIAEAALRSTSVRAVAAYEALHPALPAGPEAPEVLAQLLADVEAETARALSGTRADAVKVEHAAVEGRAAEAILNQAQDAQLIVVGTHGKGWVRRMLLGSVTREVLSEADRPVAVVDLPGADPDR